MSWLQVIQILWPIAVTILPLIVVTGFLWLNTKFPSKADLDKAEKGILAKIDAHQGRLDEGSRKINDIDKRLAVVEEECDSTPSKADLNHGISVLAGRLSGVESGQRGVERQVATSNDYLRTLIEQGLRVGTPK